MRIVCCMYCNKVLQGVSYDPVETVPGGSARVFCRFAGPGRGDCEHFVGAPAVLDPTTTDEYGIPHGWCEFCWLSYRYEWLLDDLAKTHDGRRMAIDKVTEVATEAEQLRVQLAGCATAAQGWNQQIAVQGDYGWSPAYADVLDLRAKFEEAKKQLDWWKQEFGTDNPEVARLDTINHGASEMAKKIADYGSPGVLGNPLAQGLRQALCRYRDLRQAVRQAVICHNLDSLRGI